LGWATNVPLRKHTAEDITQTGRIAKSESAKIVSRCTASDVVKQSTSEPFFASWHRLTFSFTTCTTLDEKSPEAGIVYTWLLQIMGPCVSWEITVDVISRLHPLRIASSTTTTRHGIRCEPVSERPVCPMLLRLGFNKTPNKSDKFREPM